MLTEKKIEEELFHGEGIMGYISILHILIRQENSSDGINVTTISIPKKLVKWQHFSCVI